MHRSLLREQIDEVAKKRGEENHNPSELNKESSIIQQE
jgi:hypothetical protein